MLYEILDGTPYDILEVPSALLELLQHQDKKNQSIDDNSKEYSNEQIDELLFYITPDCSFEEWIRIGMAIHHETDGEGFQLWDKWSSEGKKYPGKDTLIGHWKSFENKPNGVTIGTLIFYAKENGYDVNLKENIPAKYVAKNSFDILDSYAMTDKKCEEFKNTKYIIDGLIVEKYHTYISGPAGGGKTTVFLHMGFEMAEKDYTVYFIYLDGALSMAAEVHEEIKRRALNARYKLLIDATIEDCKKVMKEFIVNKADLSKTVFILDTFKYLTKDINNKRFNQEAMHFIKGLRNLGATFISLGHTNKNGENHSGTAEIEQDSDALLRIDATRDANEVICTIQRGGRCRCDIQEKSFKFTAGDVMSVEETDNPFELQEKKKIIAQEAKDKEFIDEVVQILTNNPNMLQKDLVAELMDNLGTAKNKVLALLDTYNNRFWTRSKSKGAANGINYSVNEQ
jgi:predicted ATP-dependent serine protease